MILGAGEWVASEITTVIIPIKKVRANTKVFSDNLRRMDGYDIEFLSLQRT